MIETTPEASVDNLPPAPAMESFWGTTETTNWYLPDGVQYFVIQKMNEGDKTKFQKLTNSDLVVGQNRTATVKMDPAAERHTLIKTSVKDWNFAGPDGSQIIFGNGSMLLKWLETADPKIVEELEHAIRLYNPWMQADMSLEEIDKEIDRLHDLRKQVIEQQAGEASSVNK